MTKQTEYNRERKAQSDAIKREFEYEKALSELYQEGSKRIQNRIDGFYLRYAGREGLTIAEAKKRARDTDVEKLAKVAKEAVRIKDFSPYTNEVLRRYNLKMQVSRLQLMQAQLEMDLQNLLSDSYELMDKARMDEMLGELKRQAGILGNSAISPSRKYKGILNADFYGATFSERVWGSEGLHGNLKRELFGSLGRIYTDMMGYKEERKRLAKQFGTSLSNANRLLKTEMSRIRTQTDHEYLKDHGFTHLIYVAEAGACPVCDALDGQAIPIHDGTMGSNLPPMHPNCRCSFYGHIKLDRKDGTSTLDEYEVWKPKETPEEEYNTGIFKADLNYIRQSTYVKKFKNNELTAPIAEQLASVSRKIIQHRAGTPYEDYYLLDVNTGKVVAVSNKARKTKGVVYNDQVRNAFKTSSEKGLVSIHNHPSGYPPSLSDLASLQQKSKNNSVKYGLTAGHDGSVYWYSRPNKRIPRSAQEKYVNQIEKFRKLGYNESVAQEKTLEMLSEVFDFEFGRIE